MILGGGMATERGVGAYKGMVFDYAKTDRMHS